MLSSPYLVHASIHYAFWTLFLASNCSFGYLASGKDTASLSDDVLAVHTGLFLFLSVHSFSLQSQIITAKYSQNSVTFRTIVRCRFGAELADILNSYRFVPAGDGISGQGQSIPLKVLPPLTFLPTAKSCLTNRCNGRDQPPYICIRKIRKILTKLSLLIS